MAPDLEPSRSVFPILAEPAVFALLELARYCQDAIVVAEAGSDTVVHLNPAAEYLFGLAPDSMVGKELGSFLIYDPDDADAPECPAARELHHMAGLRADGTLYPLAGATARLNAGQWSLRLFVARDSEASRRAEDTSKLAELVYRNTSEGMLVIDAKGIILDINPAFVRLRGYIASEAVGKHIRMLNSSRHDHHFYAAIWRQVLKTGSWQGEHIGEHKNGSCYPEWLSINTIFNADGSPFRRVLIFSNISEIKQAEAVIWHQANFDSLTQLPNRQLFHSRLAESIQRARKAGGRLALMLLDLDRFKEVNDTLGHAVGDTLLRVAAQRLAKCVRQGDTVARLGGDEFTVLLDDIAVPQNVNRVARAILKKMSEPFVLGNETVFISTSIGITFFPDDGDTIETLLNNADQAMYMAKGQGRNRFSLFTPSMQEQAQTRMRLVNDLHLALESGQLSLVYQPIVDLNTGGVIKAEALLRWKHPALGLVPPAEFIPLAEETGLIRIIGHWVFCEASRQAMRWRTMYMPDLQISVNISPVQFHNEGIDLPSWLAHLSTLSLPGEGIVVEITEGMLLDSTVDVSNQLDAIRTAGMEVSLDDFGTGYSSLSYLHKFNIDYLKIDQSFISNLEASPSDKVLCEAVIVMGHKLGLKVMAEGIETARQWRILADAGCDYGQGYLFSQPIPAAEFEMYLQSQVRGL